MNRVAAKVVIGASSFVVALPILTMVAISLCAERYPKLPWPGWSLRWYSSLLTDHALLASLRQSALVGCASALLCTIVGFCGAYYLVSVQPERLVVPLSLAALPSLLPMVVFGLCFLQLATALGFARTPEATFLAQAAAFSPASVFLLFHSLRGLNRNVENAARELGASEMRIAVQIVAWQAVPALAASFIVTFVLSWDESVVSWFVSGFDKTYPVYVRNLLESTMTPEIAAAGVLIAVGSVALTLAALRLLKRNG
jgi:spermidine/putrescine transport system permease protein